MWAALCKMQLAAMHAAPDSSLRNATSTSQRRSATTDGILRCMCDSSQQCQQLLFNCYCTRAVASPCAECNEAPATLSANVHVLTANSAR
jgi:hypothetical protein